MIGYRRAAVALHGVAEEDRSWVLNALPTADKATLVQLLSELKELGFSDDASNVVDLFDAPTKAVDVVSATVSHRIRHADAEHLFSILENEPASLIAQCLSIDQWPWSEQFLNLFPAARKERILAAVSHSFDIAPARTVFLLNSIASRLPEPTHFSTNKERSNHRNGLRGVIYDALAPVRRLAATWNR